MKKICGILCVFCAILGANEINISKSFIQSGVIKPTMLFANIRIQSSTKLRNIGELSQKDRGNITTTLNAIIQEAKTSEICTGGSYSITPIVSYKDDKRDTIGQNVSFTLNCKFVNDDLKIYNALLKNINEKIENNPLLSLPQPETESQITQIEINAKKENLFADFLTKIPEITQRYSTLLNKQCEAKSISTKDNSSLQIPKNVSTKATINASTEADSTHTKAPISNEVEVEIYINLELNCKGQI